MPTCAYSMEEESHVTDAIDTQDGRGPREPGPAERKKLADLFAAIGNAANAAITDMPDLPDERVRRQMMHTFAAVGGFVTYSDILQHARMRGSSDSTVAIVELGRALSRRVEVRES
jgi:hypothetical protein